ncbi:MAG: two-component system response regulator [Myxococcales bacterium]|nr:two-component system response regulator [Myxococcales bacterium]
MSARTRSHVTTQTIRILVVDDEVDICEYMKLLLSKSGYKVTTLTDPTEVIPELRREQYHIVVLDLMMPKMNGIEVLDQIRKIDSDIAVVIFTGHATVETAVQSLKQNVSDYIRKPFDAEEFNETIERILRDKGLLTNPEEELHKTIGKNIRHFRKDQGLTLKQLSRRTGLSVSLLSQIERAESSASVSSLYKLSAALDVRLTELFGRF